MKVDEVVGGVDAFVGQIGDPFAQQSVAQALRLALDLQKIVERSGIETLLGSIRADQSVSLPTV